MTNEAKTTPQDRIVNRIIADLESGVATWVKPWKSIGGLSIPYNAVSQKAYSGVNILILWDTTLERGYGPGGFLTFKQAKELGGYVRKGERSTTVFYVGTATREKDNGEEHTFRFLRSYYVFHVSQCEDLPARMYPQPAAPLPEVERIERAERFIRATQADIRLGGNEAFYNRRGDFIQLPRPEQFGQIEDYYSTALHELTHWTGAPHRLDREKGKRFGDHAYAFEELIAELGAAFCCSHLGIAGKLQHSEYIGSWVSMMKDHKQAVFSAASKASQAADYLRSIAEPVAIAAE